MAIQKYEYQFPEKNAFRAMEVTEQKFDISFRTDWRDQLYVDLSSVRSENIFEDMEFSLGMIDGKLAQKPNIYQKIIFSGHMGCGKTTELERFHRRINQDDAYNSIYINLERETDIQQFEAEDLYIVLIAVLLRELNQRDISIDPKDFQEISQDWVQEKEVAEELKNIGFDTEGEVGVGWKFWQFLSLQAKFKGVFSQKNITTTTIRQKIKQNQKGLISQLNLALRGLEEAFRYYHRSSELLFIIDGLEKAQPQVYESLFVKDPLLIQSLEVHLLCCVPIQTYYEIQRLPYHERFNNVYLPMVRVNDESMPLLMEIITRRVDVALFEKGVLATLVEQSGGCPRQLLRIVNKAVIESKGKTITSEIVQSTLRKLGVERLRSLTRNHRDLLLSGNFYTADSDADYSTYCFP